MFEEPYPIYSAPEVKTLHLPMDKKWFDMILSGEKKEEYRLCNPHWIPRVENWSHEDEWRKNTNQLSLFRVPNIRMQIRFFNGYQTDAPSFIMLCDRFESRSKSYHPEWGENEYDGKEHFVFHLGPIVERKGC